MNIKLGNVILRLVISILIFIFATFFVAWLLEDIIFFSLFIGFPVGFLSAIVGYVLLTRYTTRSS